MHCSVRDKTEIEGWTPNLKGVKKPGLRRTALLSMVGVLAGTVVSAVGSVVPVATVLPVVPAKAAPALDCPAGVDAPVLVGSVYHVSTAAQMRYIRDNITRSYSECLDENFVLTGNIDLGTNAGTPWVPIHAFTGSFDGNGKTISGLYATQDGVATGAGLFNTGGGATISNLTVQLDGFASGLGVAKGGLIGAAAGDVTISSVTVNSTATISGGGITGGLIGWVAVGRTLIEESDVDVDISATGGFIGGMVGWGSGATTSAITINQSAASGNLSASSGVGGLIGNSQQSSVTVSASYFSGAVSASNDIAGGLVGLAEGPVTITGSHVGRDAATNVSAVQKDAGGLVGRSNRGVTIANSSFTGNARVTRATAPYGDYAGGLVGAVGNGGGLTSISGSRVTGHVSATRTYVGGHLGFVGAGNVQIANSEFDGSVSGATEVGGLVGTVDSDLVTTVSINDSTVSASVSATQATIQSHAGGLIGAAPQLTVLGSSFHGDVSVIEVATSARLGGVAGFATSATISATTVVADLLEPQASFVGGLIGEVNGYATVSASTYTGDISARQYTGGFFGFVLSGVSITGSAASGSIAGTSHVGGLVGWSKLDAAGDQLLFATSSIDGSVTGTDFVGGLVGQAQNGPKTIEASTVAANISATGTGVGGLMGGSASFGADPPYTVTVSSSSFTGNVSGSAYVGGLVGNVDGYLRAHSNRAQGTITGSNVFHSAAGGLVGGVIQVSVSASAFTGTVSAVSAVGGLVGFLAPPTGSTDDLSISESYVRGTVVSSDVSGQNFEGAGGLIGYIRSVTTSAIAISNSFVNGSVSGSRRTGGLVGYYESSHPDQVQPLRITNTYAVGSFTAPSSVIGIGAFVGVEATASAITNSFCIDVLLCPINNTTTSATLKSQPAMEAVGWNFNTTWCFSPGKNDDYPLLRNVTSGPPSNTPCWVYIPPPPVPPNNSSTPPSTGGTPVSRSTLDPAGGTCRAGGVSHTQPWSSTFTGPAYLPGPSDCSREGFDFKGWARASTPTVISDLPLLIDPSDGALRFFVANSVDLVAVWVPKVTIDRPDPDEPDLDPRSFLAFGNFLCTRCTAVWLIWQLPATTTDASVVETVSGVSGRRICTGDVIDVASWRACRVSGLTPGRAYSFTLQLSQGSLSGSTAVAMITMRRR